ncbi:hypothetical protein AB0387_25975 [Streptomyces sp. NPDC089173]|uniref:hypothetical protein n=1 Tax=Streptomyces sp. NPDC089173 TaxID=3154965 RepID=UPI00344C704A
MPPSNFPHQQPRPQSGGNGPASRPFWRTTGFPITVSTVSLAALLVIFQNQFFPEGMSVETALRTTVIGLTAGAVASVPVLRYMARVKDERSRREEHDRHLRLAQAEAALAAALRPDAAEGGSQPGKTLGLPELWEATHARLDHYHGIATKQAETSFGNAQRAMIAGFGLLILFAGIALWASTTAVAIVAGGLGAVSAALAGYVAKTFIRSQEAAATHLRSYFDQPLELSRYLAAERLVADGDLSQEQRGEILTALVQAMVAGPQPPAPPQAVAVVPVPGQQGA